MADRLFLIGTLADAVHDDPDVSDYVAPAMISSWDPARVVGVRNEVDWWTGARLCLRRSTAGEHPEELGFGTLVEMVDMATTRPHHEQPRLSIRMELSGAELSWSDIAQLARRPDKPTMI